MIIFFSKKQISKFLNHNRGIRNNCKIIIYGYSENIKITSIYTLEDLNPHLSVKK